MYNCNTNYGEKSEHDSDPRSAQAKTAKKSADRPTIRFGHVDFGVKWEILPLCLKGKFYANHAFVHKGKILRQGCRGVHNDSILRH